MIPMITFTMSWGTWGICEPGFDPDWSLVDVTRAGNSRGYPFLNNRICIKGNLLYVSKPPWLRF